MNRSLENVQLSSDLDFDGYRILNAGSSTPPNPPDLPPGIVGDDDTRLTDQRNVPDGSVTNEKVNVLAAITQSKLNLDGLLPTSWIGAGSDQVARGDLAERASHRGSNDGYAPLNANAVIGVSRLPSTGPGVGTVTIVDLSLPRDFHVDISEVSDAGDLTAGWNNVPDKSWFGAWGTKSPGWRVGQPFFVTGPIPEELVPALDGAKFTSGIFDIERLPVGIAVGTDHAIGLVPDPMQLDMDSDKSDYLGRDLEWRRMITDTAYQPMVSDVQITLLSYFEGQARIAIQCSLKGSSLFVKSSLSPAANFVPAPSNPYVGLFDIGRTIKAYASKAGYNNSNLASYLVTPSPTG